MHKLLVGKFLQICFLPISSTSNDVLALTSALCCLGEMDYKIVSMWKQKEENNESSYEACDSTLDGMKQPFMWQAHVFCFFVAYIDDVLRLMWPSNSFPSSVNTTVWSINITMFCVILSMMFLFVLAFISWRLLLFDIILCLCVRIICRWRKHSESFPSNIQ